MFRTFFFFFTAVVAPLFIFGQPNTGSLQGRAQDEKSRDPLIGANVILKGTLYGTACDVEGNFFINQLAVGTYTVVVTAIGYQKIEIPNVTIEAGKTTQLYTVLSEERISLNEVEVVGERKTDSEISVNSEIRYSQTVAAGISGDQIAKTQDSDGAQVLRRLPGISIFDDRFVMVRGLSERYNAVLLNGALAPSTEVDNKAFSFDVLPSSVIDRMLVVKSGSYELPGEFAGGIIRIFTKNTPIENFTKVSVSSGYRVATTGRTMLGYEGGKKDWLGYDDGTRQIPAGFPATALMKADVNDETLKTREAATRQLSTTWLPISYIAMPDYKISLGLGRRWTLGTKMLSNLTSISYNNTRQLIDNLARNQYQQYNPVTEKSASNYSYTDNSSGDQVRIGVLHNWTLRFNGRHRIEFRNLFNQLGLTQTIIRTGSDAGQSSQVKNYSLYYESRRIYSGQLAGFHQWRDSKWRADWLVGYATTNRQEPDFRRFISSYSADIRDYRVPNPSGNNSLDQNARFFSDLNERSITFSTNVERRIKVGNKNEITLKAGVYLEDKKRDFAARIFVFRPSPRFNPGEYPALNNPIPKLVFSSYGIGIDKYLLDEGTQSTDQYSASSRLLAGYFGGSLPFKKWNLSTGVRVEHNVQKLESVAEGLPVSVNNPVLSILPSFNLSYNLTDRMLVRAAYAGSVNRPEFREYAPFLYYDFNNRVSIEGNKALRIPRIYNVDLRWEYYPSPEEIISIGAFYKHFIDPIEVKISGSANSSANWQPINASYANSYGAELEIRKSLASVSNSFFQKIATVVNASYIYNRVNLGELTAQQSNRTMMNQSPYIINAGLFYNHPDRGWQASMLYNIFGPRLFYAGDIINGARGNYADAFELPRHQLDFSITKSFHDKVEIRVGIQDILNSPYRFFQDSNNDGKIEVNNPDEPVQFYRKGQYVSVGIIYNW
jgi:hypothetical protein